jgi:hypothetical protein
MLQLYYFDRIFNSQYVIKVIDNILNVNRDQVVHKKMLRKKMLRQKMRKRKSPRMRKQRKMEI